ncbi:MAG TPA: DUF255 domain-containing protein [Vicinamibacterales bacterium]|nr:DUF255 domain-containing protein [Vicinamibacterales bacterium]
MPIDWNAWSPGAFTRARHERKPVLLSLSAIWSVCSRQMDETSYADERVVALVRDAFVPVRVDADRRPDIAERYTLGGLPTTAFLTPDGALMGGGTFAPPERLAVVLSQAAAAFAAGAHERPAELAPSPGATSSAAGPMPDPGELETIVEASFDPIYGGFGGEPRFPLTAPLELALERCRGTADPAQRVMLERTLDAMGWSRLHDELDGGFFRVSVTRDWQTPQHEKLLETNAALLGVYAEAADVLRVARYAERAQDVLRYVQTSLADHVDGGWAASQASSPAADDPAPAGARGGVMPGPVDRVLYTDANAAMASAALRAARVFDDPGLAGFAVRSLERVVLATYLPGQGVAHWFDDVEPGPRGLLTDQLAMASAHLDAYESTGDIVYEMMAEELAHYMLRTLWDAAAGGFFDRTQIHDEEAIGLLGQRLKPFVANCEAARLLSRLAVTSRNDEFAARAEAVLHFAGPLARAHGPLAAHYLLALRHVPIR